MTADQWTGREAVVPEPVELGPVAEVGEDPGVAGHVQPRTDPRMGKHLGDTGVGWHWVSTDPGLGLRRVAEAPGVSESAHGFSDRTRHRAAQCRL